MFVQRRSKAYLATESALTAIALVWFALALYVVVGNVIIRDTIAGAFLAQHIDRLPLPSSKATYILLWCLFFLGWIAPLLLGLKRLFGASVGNVSR